MKILVKNRTSHERGASMVEYGLLVALIAIVSLAAVGSVGRETEDKFDVIATGLGDGGSPVVEEDPGATPSGDEETADPDDEVDEDADEVEEVDEEGEETPLDPQAGDPDDAAGGPSDDPTGESPDEPGDTGNPDDTGSADDPGAPGSGDEGGTDPEPEVPDEPATPGSTVASPASDGAFYWWNDTKNGGEGAWKASATYQNDWIRHQYLTLEVTRIDEKGKRTTTKVNSFYVPAGGSSTYESWDNALKLHKGDYDGVVSVEIKVTSIQTSDESWQPVTYATDGPTTVIAAPTR